MIILENAVLFIIRLKQLWIIIGLNWRNIPLII